MARSQILNVNSVTLRQNESLRSTGSSISFQAGKETSMCWHFRTSVSSQLHHELSSEHVHWPGEQLKDHMYMTGLCKRSIETISTWSTESSKLGLISHSYRRILPVN